MPDFRYVGEQERYYPARALTVVHGDVAEWDTAPDVHWQPVDAASVTPKTIAPAAWQTLTDGEPA